MISVVLVEPEIPQNAGNIIRTCAATGCKLYLVKPLGFLLDDKHFKRAGLDYFDLANVEVVESFEEVYEKIKIKHFILQAQKANTPTPKLATLKIALLFLGKKVLDLEKVCLRSITKPAYAFQW